MSMTRAPFTRFSEPRRLDIGGGLAILVAGKGVVASLALQRVVLGARSAVDGFAIIGKPVCMTCPLPLPTGLPNPC